ncbi:hypothetical protein V8C34DRAFT_323906 [Trichoderma compactum]
MPYVTNSYVLPVAMDLDIDEKQLDTAPAPAAFELNAFWSWLSRKTHLAINIMPGDETTLDALGLIDSVILSQHDCSWKLRLAYVQLIRVTTTLKSLIVKGSRRGRLRRTVGKGNASILMDIYVRAQKDSSAPSALRQQVQKRLRLARRWADLIGGSIFLAAAYGSKADAIIKDFSVTNERIKFIASHALQACVEHLPKELRNPMFSNNSTQS